MKFKIVLQIFLIYITLVLVCCSSDNMESETRWLPGEMIVQLSEPIDWDWYNDMDEWNIPMLEKYSYYDIRRVHVILHTNSVQFLFNQERVAGDIFYEILNDDIMMLKVDYRKQPRDWGVGYLWVLVPESTGLDDLEKFILRHKMWELDIFSHHSPSGSTTVSYNNWLIDEVDIFTILEDDPLVLMISFDYFMIQKLRSAISANYTNSNG